MMNAHKSSSNNANFSVLIPSAKTGNKDSQLLIVQAFRPLVLKLALQELDPVQRVDLIDVLTIGVLEAIHKFPAENVESFPGFLKRHLLFRLAHYKRAQIRKKNLQERLNSESRTNPVYLEDFSRAERHRKLKEAYHSLSHEDRKLVYLAACEEGHTWDELAEILKKPKNTLHYRYKRSLQKMKKILKSQ